MTYVFFRQEHCEWCGATLEHKRTGRGRRFCGARCRVGYRRAMIDHARRCVDATLAGLPEPPRDFGRPVRIAQYRIVGDQLQNVT